MIDIGLTLVQGAASANNIANDAYDYLVRMVVDKQRYHIHEKIILAGNYTIIMLIETAK